MSHTLLPHKKSEPLVKYSFTRGVNFLIFFVIAIAFLSLAGWQFNIEVLKRPIPHLVAMNPLTAVSFIITGISFLLLSSKNPSKQKLYAGYGLASFVIATSIIKIASVLLSLNIKIDHILFSKQIQAHATGNLSSNMAVNTALGFIFSGIALLLLNYETSKKRMPSHFLALAIFLLGFFSVMGSYLWSFWSDWYSSYTIVKVFWRRSYQRMQYSQY